MTPGAIFNNDAQQQPPLPYALASIAATLGTASSLSGPMDLLHAYNAAIARPTNGDGDNARTTVEDTATTHAAAQHTPAPAAATAAATAAASSATPKRTVLSVTAAAYSAPPSSDPLAPLARNRGLPKNAQEVWRAFEEYFRTPASKECDALSSLAYPEYDPEVVGEEVASEALAKTIATMAGAKSAPPPRRAAPPPSRASIARAERQSLLASLRREQLDRDQALVVGSLVRHAHDVLHLESPAVSASPSYSRFQDSRTVLSALSGTFPLPRETTEVDLVLRAVWKGMDEATRRSFDFVNLPIEAYECAAEAARVFWESLPVPPAEPSPSPAPTPSAPRSGSKKSDQESDEEDDELDVDALSLPRALEMLDELEGTNVNTALKLQHSWTRSMIGTLARNADLSPYDREVRESLCNDVAYASSILSNPRHSKPFTFSLTTATSRRANDRRRMDLTATGSEQRVLHQWIQTIDRMELWKYRREDDEPPPKPGQGKGKAPPERVDSHWVEEKTRADQLHAQPRAQKTKMHLSQLVALPPAPEEEPDIVCCVCGSGDTEDDDQILFCDRCDIAVHQDCYGIASVPAHDWYCAPCSLLISKGFPKVTPQSPQYCCAVCWQKGGAMKRLYIDPKHYKSALAVLNTNGHHPPANLTFAHPSCAMWIGELFFGDSETMTPICGLQNLNPQRFKLKCGVCKKAGGACVQCCDKKCVSAFHMQCALEHGLQLDIMNDSSQASGASYILLCDKHRNTPRINTTLKSAEGVVSAPQCQVCCYNVAPEPVEGVPNDMLCCTDCNLQVHQWCYYGQPREVKHSTRATPMTIELISSEGECKSNTNDTAQPSLQPAIAAADGTMTVPGVAAVRKFLCRVCESIAQRRAAAANGTAPAASSATTETPACALCLATQGALKSTVDGRWVCLPCTYFTPELFFGDPQALESVDGLTKAFKARGKLKCTVCDRQNGCPVQCGNFKCQAAYHVSCAFAQGWQFTINKNNTTNLPFISYCGTHSRSSASASSSLLLTPAYAQATFTSYALPGEDDGVEVLDLTGESMGATTAKAKAQKRKSNDSDEDEVEEYKGARSKSRPAERKSGVGALIFEKAARAGAAASSAGPKRSKYLRIVFMLDHVPVHIHIGDKAGSRESTVFINAPVNDRKKKRKFKQTATVQQVIKTGEEGEEDNMTDGVATHAATPASASAAAAAAAGDSAKRLRSAADAASSAAAAGASFSGIDSLPVGSDSASSADVVPPSAAGNKRFSQRAHTIAATNASLSKAGLSIQPDDHPPAASTIVTSNSRSMSGGSRMPAATIVATAGNSDSDDDGDFDGGEEDPDKPLCVCRQPYRSTDATMVGCDGGSDGCAQWYHLICLGIHGDAAERIAQLDSWICPRCCQ